MNIEVTDSTVEEVLKKGGITILDFWAPWCGPCKVYGPILDDFAKDNDDVIVGKINVDENPVIAQKHGIRSIPTTILFKDGQLISKIPGVIAKPRLDEFIGNLR